MRYIWIVLIVLSVIPRLSSQESSTRSTVVIIEGREHKRSAFGGWTGLSSALLGKLLRSKHVKDRLEAAEILASRGGAFQALDDLLLACKDQHASVRTAVAWALGTIGAPAAKQAPAALMRLLSDKELNVRQSAISSLNDLIPFFDKDTSKSVMPALVKSLEKKDLHTRTRAAAALMSLGHEKQRAANIIVESFGTMGDTDFRLNTLVIYGRIGTNIFPAIVRALNHRNDSVRIDAVMVLYRAATFKAPDARKPFPKQTVQALIKGLKDKSPFVVCRAMMTLAVLGNKEAPSAVKGLIECLAHPDEEVRYAAVKYLWKFDSAAIIAIPALEQALNDRSKRVRKITARALHGLRALQKDE